MADVIPQDQFLTAIGRAIPDSYLDPIRDVGPGYELYQASAAVGVRASRAVANFDDDVHILTARGGVLATVPCTFYRDNASAGAGVMLKGTLVRASRTGASFQLIDNVVFGALTLEATGTAQAIGFGYEWNIRGPYVDRDGTVWPGELDVLDLPLQDPVFFDPSIRVRNDADADGLGRPATLDALGGERDLDRQTGESDLNYRARVRTLDDTVSPAAINRQLDAFFRPYPGLFYRHVETWEHRYQECFDAPDEGPTPFEPYDSSLFSFDDPRPKSPMQNRLLGINDYLGAFIVEVAMPPAIQDYGYALDDPADVEADVQTSAGIRAFSAFDEPDEISGPSLPNALDGADFGIERLFFLLYDLLDRIKSGGIFVVIAFQEVT